MIARANRLRRWRRCSHAKAIECEKDEIKNRRAGCDRHEEIRLSEVSHHRGIDSTA